MKNKVIDSDRFNCFLQWTKMWFFCDRWHRQEASKLPTFRRQFWVSGTGTGTWWHVKNTYIFSRGIGISIALPVIFSPTMIQ